MVIFVGQQKNDLLGYRKEIRFVVNKSQLIFPPFFWCLIETLVVITFCLLFQGVICDCLFLLYQVS